jgi:hypothetical protein
LENARMENEETVQQLGVADSMTAAVAMLSRHADLASRLSEEQLKRAKAAGCPAFRGSRVFLDELLLWWEENAEVIPTGDSELDRINRELAAEKLRKARFANNVAEGKYVEIGAYSSRVEKLAGTTLSLLRRKIEDEAPRRQEGKTQEELRTINAQIVDEICIAVEAALRG